MKKQLIVCAFLFLFAEILSAQVYNLQQFQGLDSQGEIPEDFTKLSSLKFQEDVENIEESNSNREQRDKEDFLLQSNFLMDDILHSGRVIFGDPVTNYLNEIKDNLLKDDKEARNEIRIYTLLSNEVNAFTANNGIVLVTTGLVAQVENEAQLAFILCHEFNHYTEKHAINSYVETKRMERGTGIYRSLDPRDIDLERFRYSKELETEADDLGLDLYKKSNYSLQAVEGVFDVLLYSYLPFDEVEFNKTYFNNGRYVLPDELFLDTLSAITAEEDYDDEESTHPNIKKRREAIYSAIETLNDDNRKYFIQPEDEFRRVQDLCRYEGCDIYLNDLRYEDAFYQAYLLQLDDPDNPYLKKVMAQAIYGLSAYHSQNASRGNRMRYDDVEGYSQQVFYLFEKIPDDELSVLALKYAWQAHKANPDNLYIENICKQLAGELANIHNLYKLDFYTTAQMQADSLKLAKETTAVSQDSTKEEPIITEIVVEKKPVKSSKYQKIKSEEKAADIKNEVNYYWKYAFAEYLNEKEFTDLLKTSKTEKEDDEAETIRYRKSRYKKIEYQLGVDDIVIVNPAYYKIDETKNNPIKYEAAEKSRVALREKINESGDVLNLDIEYLDHNFLKDTEAKKFNDLAVLNAWLAEELEHLDSDADMINSMQEEFEAVAEKYGTDHFAWIGIVSFKEPEENVGSKLLACILYPLIPFIVADLVTPNYSTFFFTLVANAETGNFEMEFYNNTNLNDKEAVQTSNIFYIMQQIKTDPKK